ncbi:MAG: peptide chain release factor N(5)-glutamine methyltransferase [Oscillibacter sp.]|nr:peptide chain release factor N(5)-glutamine methyltransferase [Oscillibacter sp.]
MTTYQNLYLDIRRQLLRAGFPGAGLEARELVCCGSGKSREEFYRDSAMYMSPDVEAAIRALTERHIGGEPVAYLIGEWEFYGLTLDVNESVLIPRADTEVLAEAAIEHVKSIEKCRVLDLCAGSGCVGLAIAANAPDSRVLLGEISEAAIRVCRQNVRRCGLTERVKASVLDALEPPPRTIGDFQCVVCNPPYIPRSDMETLDRSVKDFEPHLALCGGEDGLDFYRAVVGKWKPALAKEGRLYFEVGIGQADAVLRLMRREGFGDINILPDTQGIGRVVYGTILEEARR